MRISDWSSDVCSSDLVTGAPLVVTLSNGQSITIPVGSSSGSVNFVTQNDALAGGDNLSVKIDDAQGGNYEKLDIDATPADTTVTDVQDTTGLTLSRSEEHTSELQSLMRISYAVFRLKK